MWLKCLRCLKKVTHQSRFTGSIHHWSKAARAAGGSALLVLTSQVNLSAHLPCIFQRNVQDLMVVPREGKRTQQAQVFKSRLEHQTRYLTFSWSGSDLPFLIFMHNWSWRGWYQQRRPTMNEVMDVCFAGCSNKQWRRRGGVGEMGLQRYDSAGLSEEVSSALPHKTNGSPVNRGNNL